SRRLQIPAARQVEQTLADVADPQKPRARAALEYLASLRPDPASRAKGSRALNALLLDPDTGIAADALDAVRVWGTKENTTTLLKLLGDFPKGGGQRNARVIEILGSLQDPAAAPALAQGLTDFRERGLVSTALKALGAGAEEA